MRPKPWSHSALECHDNCAWCYHEKYVAKNLPPEEKSDEQNWGLYVHKQFEDYLTIKPDKIGDLAAGKSGYEMPIDLRIHEPFLQGLLKKDGILWAERQVALSRQPFGVCAYFGPDVWWRGVLDVTIVEVEEGRATIVDHKTGKPHQKWEQLAMSAVYTFVEHPGINLVNAQFYWTVDQTVTKKVWGRSEMDSLIGMFLPKLQAYVHSWKNDAWPKKQSGLCAGWCPVTTCEFWTEKRPRRR